MKFLKRILSVSLVVAMLLGNMTLFAEELPDITVTLDNTKLSFDVVPQIADGRTLVPMRTIFESFDMVVSWDENSKTVTAKSEGNEISLKAGDKTAYVNGEKKTLDCAAQIINGRTMVPLRFISEALGCKVNWNEDARSIKISSEMERKPLEIKSIKSIDDLETKELVDKNYATKWTHESPQSWLLFELAEVTTVGYAGVSWYQGKQRYADFEIQVSVDGENFETAFDGTAGYGETFLPYSLGNKQAKFIKFIGKGNDVNGINSVQEIRFYPPHKSGQMLINDQDMIGREREPVEITPELRAALDELEKLFEPDRVLTLIASLYDKEIGGFYGAASARDYPQFLPDIESTNAALSFMKTYGALEMDMLGEELTNKIVTWLQGLQNPDDGFFYLPQDKGLADINILNRSTNSAKTCLSRLGATALYPYPWDRGISQSATGQGTTYNSKQDVRIYIESLPWNQNPWKAGNDLSNQLIAINSAGAGYLDYAEELVIKLQNQETGFWGLGKSFETLSGALKVAYLFRSTGHPIPNSDKFMRSAVEVMMSDELADAATDIWNTWNLMNIARTLESPMDKETESYMEEMWPVLIRKTAERLLGFKGNDGGFMNQYGKSGGGAIPRTAQLEGESDMWGISGIYGNVLSAVYGCLGLDAPIFYTKEDGERFVRIMKGEESVDESEKIDAIESFDIDFGGFELKAEPEEPAAKLKPDLGSLTVAKDPFNYKNKILKFYTAPTTNTSYSVNGGTFDEIKYAKISFDLMLSSEDGKNGNMSYVTTLLGGMCYMNIKRTGAGGTISMMRQKTSGENAISLGTLAYDDWNHIEVEYYPYEENCIVIKINDKVVLETSQFTDVDTKERMTRSFDVLNFSFSGYKPVDDYAYLDNIKGSVEYAD